MLKLKGLERKDACLALKAEGWKAKGTQYGCPEHFEELFKAGDSALRDMYESGNKHLDVFVSRTTDKVVCTRELDIAHKASRNIFPSLLRELETYLVECMGDTEEEAIREIRRYKKEFSYYAGYNIYAYGNILPYYYAMRAFCENCCALYMPENDSDMQNIFELHIKKAVDNILASTKYKDIA